MTRRSMIDAKPALHWETVERDGLPRLDEEAAAEGLVPRRIEHSAAWLGRTEHGPGIVPKAFVLRTDGGRPMGYVPVRQRRISLPLRLGEMKMATVPLRVLELFGDGFVGAPDLADAVVECLVREMREADGLSVGELPTGAPLLDALRRAADGELTLVERGKGTHHAIDFPDGWDTYWGGLSSKTRTNLRRAERRLEERYGSYRVESFGSGDDVERLSDAVERVVVKTFHYRLLRQDLTRKNRRHWENVALWARHGWFNAFMLFGGEQPLAYALGYVVGTTYQYEQIGYDPECAGVSPGNFLLAQLIRKLFEDGRIRRLDFGEGDAEYKHLFGNVSYEEARILVVRKAVYAQTAVALERTFDRASRVAVRWLERAGVRGAVKRAVRRAFGESGARSSRAGSSSSPADRGTVV